VYERKVISRLLAAPATLIHGELYPSNVVVGGVSVDGTMTDCDVRICPVDWESAAAGPALLDLAAITTGDWTDADRDQIIAAYRHAAGGRVGWDDFDRDLAACSLQLAIQWLGWFVGHEPPPWQRRNWIEEAEAAAQRLA
jgi:thiamine kinase-like enzyme